MASSSSSFGQTLDGVPSFILITSSIVIVLSTLILLVWKNKKSSSSSSSLPLPPPAEGLGFFELLALKAEDQVSTVSKYGDIFTVTSPHPMLIPNTVVVSHPAIVKKLTVECTNMYRPPFSFTTRTPVFASITRQVVGTGVTGLTGDEWSWRKKALLKEFHRNKLLNSERGLAEIILKHGQGLCRSLDKGVTSSSSSSSTASPSSSKQKTITVDLLTTQAAVGVVLYTLLGREVDFDCEQFRQAAKDLMDCLAQNFVPTYKFLKYIPNTAAYKTEQKKYNAWKIIDDVVGTEIDLLLDEYHGIQPIHPDRKPGSVVASLIENEERFRKGGKEGMLAEARVFVQAGFETTAHSLAFSMAMMAERPDLASEMAKEVRDVIFPRKNGVVENCDDIDISAIDQLSVDSIREAMKLVPSVKNFFMESLRLYPLAPALGGSCVSDIIIEHEGHTYNLPKGTSVQFLNVPLQRHEASVHHKTNGSEIIPERWDVSNVRDKPFLHTFQNGPHTCPGKSLSLLEGHVFLMLAVLYFEFEFPEGVDSVEFDHAILLRPKDGMPLLVKRREW